MIFENGTVTCSCGWEETFTPPLVIDQPGMSINGRADRPYVNCHDSTGKLIRHDHDVR